MSNPTQPQPFSAMQVVYDMLGQIAAHTLDQPGYRSQREKIGAAFRAALHAKRHYLIADSNDLQRVWDPIRVCAPATDFLMDVTAQLHAMLATSSLPFDSLSVQLAQAYGAHRGGAGRNQQVISAIDEDLIRRLPERENHEKLYQNNPWYVTLLLFSHRPSLMGL